MRALVYGLARSGRAVAERLAERGDEAVLVDRSLGNEEELGLLEGVDVVVKSPGVPGDVPLVAAARERGIPVWSEVEYAWRLLPAGIGFVGVTGTNGKTTTTELLGSIFRAAGHYVAVAGNVGTPLGSVRNAGWVICELSSFQLEDVETLSCDVAVLLNLEPDHLDRHGSFEAYRDAKLRIFERARVRIVPRGLGLDGIEFSADDPLPAEPLLRGAHNRENAAAATAAARAAGIDDVAIATGLQTFAGVPHRLESVRGGGEISFVNDSKATNVAAARRALAAYSDEPVHLILGGSLKGESFEPLAEAIGSNVRSIHLIGEAAPAIASALAGRAFEIDETLERAVARAAELAEPGDVVLFSPACASFDQFENFEQRGDSFRELVAQLGA
ncbi:MAG TPA: UDP-N-acetylmuramoyl-L-alanine--D-glutamate ligase [Gaiellaceae bacterium]|nr:UDP-N-acetylmuramoyl-L-alanine--D-glutamate ligase [Gaiellaceae bacterium]